MEKVELLRELEELVTEVRDSDLTQISKLTKRLILADYWVRDDMLMLKLVYKMIDAVDFRLHAYEMWLREALDKLDNEEQ